MQFGRTCCSIHMAAKLRTVCGLWLGFMRPAFASAVSCARAFSASLRWRASVMPGGILIVSRIHCHPVSVRTCTPTRHELRPRFSIVPMFQRLQSKSSGGMLFFYCKSVIRPKMHEKPLQKQGFFTLHRPCELAAFPVRMLTNKV